MVHGHFDRAGLEDLGAQRSHFEHFLERDFFDPPRFRHDARVGRVDAVDIGIDVADLGIQRGGNRHGARIGPAPAERGHTLIFRDALETGDHGDLAGIDGIRQAGIVKAHDAGLAMALVGLELQLPAEPGARLQATLAQRQRQEAGGDLLARGDDDVIFIVILLPLELAACRTFGQGDQLVGLPCHGRNDHGHMLTLLCAGGHNVSHVRNAIEVSD